MNYFDLLLIQPLANGLVLFYRIFFNNLGLAIVGFSVFLRFVLNPLTKPYMESMKKMKSLAPALEKLKKKYGKDKIKFAQAQADFYKEKGINPGGGCLPYILQFIILIAFFQVFTRTLSAGGDITGNFNKLLYPALKFSEGQSVNTRFLYLDVAKPDTFRLPGVPIALPGPLLILAALVQLYSSKIMTPQIKAEKKIAKKTPSDTDDLQVSMQKSMTYTFPLFTIIFGMSFPSGLAIYWLLFSLFQLLSQMSREDRQRLVSWFTQRNLLKFPRLK